MRRPPQVLPTASAASPPPPPSTAAGVQPSVALHCTVTGGASQAASSALQLLHAGGHETPAPCIVQPPCWTPRLTCCLCCCFLLHPPLLPLHTHPTHPHTPPTHIPYRYGFLSENAPFSKACEQQGVRFVGPPAAAIVAMGDKSEAKRIMSDAQVPVVPGYHGSDQDDAK